MTEGLIVFGHAYAVGQPLPIYQLWLEPDSAEGTNYLSVDDHGHEVVLVHSNNGPDHPPTNLTAALAHYGPPESLVGKWALQLRVQQ